MNFTQRGGERSHLSIEPGFESRFRKKRHSELTKKNNSVSPAVGGGITLYKICRVVQAIAYLNELGQNASSPRDIRL